MAARNLYLHEVIDIIGQGQYDYMDHSRKEPTNVMPDMLTLQGTFFVCAMGGAVALAFVTGPGRDFFDLDLPPTPILTAAAACIGAAGVAMMAAHKLVHEPVN